MNTWNRKLFLRGHVTTRKIGLIYRVTFWIFSQTEIQVVREVFPREKGNVNSVWSRGKGRHTHRQFISIRDSVNIQFVLTSSYLQWARPFVHFYLMHWTTQESHPVSAFSVTTCFCLSQLDYSFPNASFSTIKLHPRKFLPRSCIVSLGAAVVLQWALYTAYGSWHCLWSKAASTPVLLSRQADLFTSLSLGE